MSAIEESVPSSSSSLVGRIARRAALAIVLLAVIAGGAWGVVRWRSTHAEPVAAFRTVHPEVGSVSAKVTATGTLSARVTVQVGSQVSGRIAQLFVDYNSPVKKGQVIAKLDPGLFQAQVAKSSANVLQAKGALEKAKANLVLAEKALARAKALKTEGLMGDADLETAENARDSAAADIEVQKGNLASASADLGQAQINLQYATIRSPIDGIVLSRSVDVGQTVAASLQAPVLFTIAQDLSKIQVDTYVAEADVGKIQPGMVAAFTVDAYPGKKFKGTVREIRNAAQNVQNVVTYDAVLDVDNDELKLKPGMTANVTFVVAEAKDVLTVPNAALRFRPPADAIASGSASGGFHPGGAHSGRNPNRHAANADDPTRKSIWVLRDGKAAPVRIETGVTDGSITEVASKRLSPSDEVIVDLATPNAGGGGGARPPSTRGMGRMF